MKKIILLTLLFLISTMIFADFVHEYSFDKPQVEEKGEYAVLNFKNARNFANEGEPLVPFYSAELLLPQNEILKDVKIIDIEYYNTIKDIKLQPGGKILPLSHSEVSKYEPVENEEIYNSEKYPEQQIDYIDTHFKNGHSIGSFSFCPIEYNPRENQIRVIKSIQLQIITTIDFKALQSARFLKNKELIIRRIKDIVDNPNMLSVYSYPPQKDEEYDLLLITSEELMPGFDDYINFKENTGYAIKTKSVEDIYIEYSGQDHQEQIRNCIIDYYENHSITYVILGGDSAPNNPSEDIIPHRGFYVNMGSGNVDYDIPSDMYYGYLDGTWNDDGDNQWGEPNEADLLAEVYVGRICVSNLEQINNSLNKQQMYQDQPVEDDISKALMVGEYLWPGTYGGQYKDEVYQGSSNHGYETAGLSDNFSVNSLYEMNADWSKYQLFDEFNEVGINILNHLGHSNTNFNMKLYNSDVNTTNLTNDGVERGFVIGYSQGCYAGSFDNRTTSSGSYNSDESIAEYLTTIETAEAAFIANSRYGWGQQGSTNGASQYFDRQFFDAIFAEDYTQIGIANDDSKEDNISYINQQEVIRWCAYELILFGDPTLDIWTNTPTDILADYPASIPIGTNTMEISTNTPNARIGITQDGILLGRAVTDDLGNATLEFFQPIDSSQLLNLSIIAHNKNRLQDEIVVVSDQPYVIFDEAQFNDENNNGLVEYGEEVSIDITLWNVGNQNANNVEANLICEDEHINITDATHNYGTINAESTMNIEEAFTFTVSDNVPDEHEIQFELVVTGNEKETWNSHFNLTLYAPELQIDNYTISDELGNSDGILDPGETAELQIPVSNIGHSLSPFATADIICEDEGIFLEETTFELGEIAPDTTKTATYTITADETIAIGTTISFDFVLSADAYGSATILEHCVGLLFDDFETGDFSKFNWQFAGDAEFSVVTEAYEGEYAVKTGDIGSNSTTSLIIELDILNSGELSFWKKVSCEDDTNDNWDYFAFFIDGEEIERWDGEVAWSEEIYEVEAGNHTFEWKYRKDGYVDEGSDCAWLDYIVFPVSVPPVPPEIGWNISEIQMDMETNSTETTSFELSNVGGGTLDYTLYLQNPDKETKDISDSYLECETEEFEPGETVSWNLSAFNASTDNEWIQEVYITLPVGVTLENASDFETNGDNLEWNEETGNGVTTSWSNGDIYTQDYAEAEIEVSIDLGFEGDIVIPYTLKGDEYGSPPHEIEGEITIQSVGDPITWITLDPMEGSLNSNETDEITVNFDTAEMEPGTYNCEILISTNTSDTIVPVTLNLVQTSNQPNLPMITKLEENYPNPFNPETTINFSIKEAGHVKLEIYNIKGQKIKTLVNSNLEANSYNLVWNGRDDNNQQVSSGVYFYRMNTPTYTSTRKMILMK
ncbi:MAG: C25 family cysteine peptidase [Candidatus Cloacimonadota bacterium]|nr:C25 family cysteine peptidase [Candidatus Cloacimonadota bacterium]